MVSRLPAPAPAKPRRGTARGGARLREALSTGPAPRVIAEVKRRSPSAGPIADIADPAALARQYVERGARAISVLTNAADFGGSLEDLRRVRAAVDVPLLRKDFIVHPAQLDEAAEAGADAVLLIAGLLGGGLARMRAAAEARGLEALVEVHDEAELRLALDAGATLLGINNRDLRTFEVDLAVSERLAPRIPPHVLVVSESGVRSREALERLRTAGLENFLVGEFLVRGGVL
ncbi:MAG: indole-3-glycerol phosphate synthase TrpC [Myxococcota bacterium]